MASVAGTEDIDNILTSTVNLRDKWVGNYKQGKSKLNQIACRYLIIRDMT